MECKEKTEFVWKGAGKEKFIIWAPSREKKNPNGKVQYVRHKGKVKMMNISAGRRGKALSLEGGGKRKGCVGR